MATEKTVIRDSKGRGGIVGITRLTLVLKLLVLFLRESFHR
jgi:hypothetical protein